MKFTSLAVLLVLFNVEDSNAISIQQEQNVMIQEDPAEETAEREEKKGDKKGNGGKQEEKK